MPLLPNQLELLSPARNTDIAREAILHGADAVYLGGPSFGARSKAGNSISDLAKLVEFARFYNAKVMIAFNTILHDNELEAARKQVHELYSAGIDALIVQDMALLEMDLPPIELHASTQCDIRSLDKAKFLGDAGFSQLVLARELNLDEISQIHREVDTALEFFVHGALCVAYSGQCYISHAQTGRSANRGDCSQACRLPFTLKDQDNAVIAYEKHLLSMKDNDQSANVTSLVKAGIRSFKIEGRYKDLDYVKNITAHYRKLLDEVLAQRSDLQPASSGVTEHFFTPNTVESFNRGSTDYFVNDRLVDVAAFDSPKHLGQKIGQLTAIKPVKNTYQLEVKTDYPLVNGDGLNIFYKREIIGFRASLVELVNSEFDAGAETYTYRVEINNPPPELPRVQLPTQLSRNFNQEWQAALTKNSAQRLVGVSWQVIPTASHLSLQLTSEEGLSLNFNLAGPFELANNPENNQQQLEQALSQLGGTNYNCQQVSFSQLAEWFVPARQVKSLRRQAIAELTQLRLDNYQRGQRKTSKQPLPVFPEKELTYLANVHNHLARKFYQRHGVELIEAAYEANEKADEAILMLTKHCLRFSFYMCPKQTQGYKGVINKVSDLQLVQGDEVLTLSFDCKNCQMQVKGKIKPQILKLPALGSEA